MTTMRKMSGRELQTLEAARVFRAKVADELFYEPVKTDAALLHAIVGYAAEFGAECAPAGGVARAMCREIARDPKVIA